MWHFAQRRPGRFAEYVPPKPVPTRTSSPFGRNREGVDWCVQKMPEPLVVAMKPSSSGPPHTLHFEFAIRATRRAPTGPGYLSFAPNPLEQTK